MAKVTLLIFTLFACAYICCGLKVLTIFPYITKSHNILGDGINRHLLNAGHEVTYITAFMKNNTHPKLRQIDVTSNFDMIPEEKLSMSTLHDSATSMTIGHALMMVGFHMMTKWTILNGNVQKLLHDPEEHFDVVISDWSLNEITLSGIAKIYDAPLIWMSTVEPHWMILQYVDEACHPAYNSDVLSPKIPPFTFWERLSESWIQLKVTFYKEYLLHYFDAHLYNSEIAPIIKQRGREPPSAQELRYNSSLVLSNSHVSFGEPLKLPVNFIPVGGFHIDENVKPLSRKLQKIMDNAKNGVIYFSLGSLVKSKDLAKELKDALAAMFGKLKQTVIWKFEEDRDDLPNNVHLVKWAPQQSILAHPNCTLFITHGGLLSTIEAMHYGVPIIGIPVFADQFNNIDKAANKGYAKKITLRMNPSVADDLEEAIDDILSDPKYRKKMEELSFIYRHRLVKPGVEIVHWVEHVVRTGGAPHMRSSALHVPLYQKMYLDILTFVAAVFIVVRLLYKYVFRNILSRIAVRKKKMN